MRQLLLSLVVLSLTACSSGSGSDPDPQPVPPPKAVATLNFAVAAGETVVLDGSQSSPGVQPSVYTWTVTDSSGNIIPVNSGAAASGMAAAAALVDSSDPIATFDAPVGSYTATLTVTDSTEATSSAEGGVIVYDNWGPVVPVLVLFTDTTIQAWLVNENLEIVPLMIQNGYPELQEGWDNGTVHAVVIQVPNQNLFSSDFFYVDNLEIKMRVM